jgi:transposase
MDRLSLCDRQVKGRYLTPFQRGLLQSSLDGEISPFYRQRLQIMLLADEGKKQKEICQIVNCSAATARHWIAKAQMGLAHQWQEEPIGRPQKISFQYRERLKELVGHNPQNYGHSFQRWTGAWLGKHLAQEFGFEVHERHINRLLKEVGLSTRSPSSPSVSQSDYPQRLRVVIQDLAEKDLP